MNTFLRHREKVLAHAEDKLASRGRADGAERLQLYRKFLKIENHRLRLRHGAGGGGREIATQRATLVEIVLRHLYDSAMADAAGAGRKPRATPGLALVATGGFGRGELNPHSDVDILFLHANDAKALAPQINAVVQSVLYMLWDIGFKVGHATRSVAGAIKQANADMQSKTSLLEARLIAGDPGLFDTFRAEFLKKCVRGSESAYIAERVRDQAARHGKHGGSIYMQEPNVKSGCGGLRDYQNLLWMSFFKTGAQTTAQLVEKKLLHESERRELERAYDFLLRVRTELHYLNGRAHDILTLGQQVQVADRLGYTQKNVLRRSEAFMRDYYTHARNIYRLGEQLSERLALPPPRDAKPRLLRAFAKTPGRETFDGFYAERGRIFPSSPTIFRDDPFRMMRLFQHAQLRRLALAPELQQLVRRSLKHVDKTFQYSREARATFGAILSRKGEVARALRMMHETDFLGRYLPEFGALTCLVQHEFFHRYTADEHTLVCIEKLDELIESRDPRFARYRDIFTRIEDPFVLYLALLLHDVGKAANTRNHSEASATLTQRVARRLQLRPDQRTAAIRLVDNHIVLSEMAQRRNPDDPATIAEFATIINSRADLDNLMLLTLADGRGTGGSTWSDWKESLVWSLYEQTCEFLEDSTAYFRQRLIQRESLRKEVGRQLPRDFSDEIDAHFDLMPDRYFRTSAPAQIAEHIRLFREFLETRIESPQRALEPVLRWIARPDEGHSEVWICTWDRHELLAKIAGSFAAEDINILSADIFTRGDDLVLDIFRVCDTDFRPVTDRGDMLAVQNHLSEALRDAKFDFTRLIERRKSKVRSAPETGGLDFPTRIRIRSDAHPAYTLVEIETPDRLGLLHELLRAFSKLHLDIGLARIATERGAAIDSFYVTRSDGQKIAAGEETLRLQRALQRAANPPPP